MTNNYIPTKKKRVKYHFVTSKGKFQFQNNRPLKFFYQICTFPNITDGLYHIRRYTIDQNDRFVDIKYFRINKKQLKKLFKTTKPHCYKCYSTYTLESVNPPTIGEIMIMTSDILDHDYSFTGWMPFHKY